MGQLCSICPEGCTTVWIGEEAGGVISWTRLVHLDKWEMVPNRTEAPKKRTSDTGRAGRKFCSDVLDWTVNLTNTLCETDWLYCDILEDPTNPSVGKTAYFFLGWDCDYLPASEGGAGSTPSITDPDDFGPYTGTEAGVYLSGTVMPPGFGLDNTTSDPATADWTIEVATGPYFPYCNGTWTGSDGEIG